MRSLVKPLAEWTAADVQALIDQTVDEAQRLEYKHELDLEPRRNRLEACKDTSGVANATGGVIIYDVAERELDDGRR